MSKRGKLIIFSAGHMIAMKIKLLLLFVVLCCFANADLVVYDGTTGLLQNGFQTW